MCWRIREIMRTTTRCELFLAHKSPLPSDFYCTSIFIKILSCLVVYLSLFYIFSSLLRSVSVYIAWFLLYILSFCWIFNIYASLYIVFCCVKSVSSYLFLSYCYSYQLSLPGFYSIFLYSRLAVYILIILLIFPSSLLPC